MTESDASWADRIVAEFGDGHPVEAIAARYGLSVEQVYAVVQGEVGPTGRPAPHYAPPPAQGDYPPAQGYYAPPPAQGYYPPPPPAQGYYPPPPPPPGPPPATQPPVQGYYAPPAYGFPAQPPPFPNEDAIVAEYADGHDVNAIAFRYGLTVDQVYWVVQRALHDDGPPAPPLG
ncbi:hypothetical protein [Actinoplanes sp. NPDC020271]|uniref:hypothetical protein n=1 Tax=Actinoplanes sp. NPDC020271 TaxID=3363896 RepID=UPI0037A57DD8